MSSLPKPPLGPPPDWLQAAPAEMERLRDYLLNSAHHLSGVTPDWGLHAQVFQPEPKRAVPPPGDHRHSVCDPGHSHTLSVPPGAHTHSLNPVERDPYIGDAIRSDRRMPDVAPATWQLALALARALTEPPTGNQPIQQGEWMRLRAYLKYESDGWHLDALQLAAPPKEAAKPAPVARKGWRY